MELSKEEREAIESTRRFNEAQARLRAYAQEVSRRKTDFYRVTAEELVEDIVEACAEDGKPFIIDDDNRRVVELLSWYFTGDTRFEEAGLSLKKGIYLYGDPGLGKTRIMHLFRAANQRQAFRLVDCSEIAATFVGRDGGEDSLKKYFHDTPLTIEHRYGLTTAGFCFDDLGTESEGRYFGNNVNCMERIIEVRYRSNVPLVTHVTSNLTTDQIEARYGIRIRERMREMFNLVSFPTTAKSRRK